MLSLPFIAPRADESLWPSHRTTATYLESPTSDTQPTNNGQQSHQRRPGSHHGHGSTRTVLASLAADENVISQRKQNIQRFGAGWIRPPGIAKTYQALMDESAEREEQEALARREQVLMDLQAAQTEAANQEAREEGEDQDMDGEGERDLDDDVPEAEASVSEISGSVDDDVSEEEESALDGTQGELTFNEDSFIEGSLMVEEVEHMLEREDAERAGVLQDERDLDDDIPEAGSYEHTDTEIDESSDAEAAETSLISGPSTAPQRRRSSARRSLGQRSSRRRSSGVPSLHSRQRDSLNFESNRTSLHLQDPRSSFGLDGSSSLLEGSSFLRSSPAAARGDLRARFMGARTQRGG